MLVMAGFLATVLGVLVVKLPKGLPTGRKSAKFREVFSKTRNINWLSFARMFLFGARDVWFVVGIPIYFYAVLSDGTAEGNRAAFFMIGGFMALWIILYGAVQAGAPKLLGATSQNLDTLIRDARVWGSALVVVPSVLAVLVFLTPTPTPWLTATIIAGLLILVGYSP